MSNNTLVNVGLGLAQNINTVANVHDESQTTVPVSNNTLVNVHGASHSNVPASTKMKRDHYFRNNFKIGDKIQLNHFFYVFILYHYLEGKLDSNDLNSTIHLKSIKQSSWFKELQFNKWFNNERSYEGVGRAIHKVISKPRPVHTFDHLINKVTGYNFFGKDTEAVPLNTTPAQQKGFVSSMTEHCINASIRDWIIQDRVDHFKPSKVGNCDHNREHKTDLNNCDPTKLSPFQPPPNQHLPTFTNLAQHTPTQNPISNGERLATTTSTAVTNTNIFSHLDNFDYSTGYNNDLSNSYPITTYHPHPPFNQNLVTPRTTEPIENIIRPFSTIFINDTKLIPIYTPPPPCLKSSPTNLFNTPLSSPDNNSSSPSYEPSLTPNPNTTVRNRKRKKLSTPAIEGFTKRKMMRGSESKSGTPSIGTDLVGKRIEVCFEYTLPTGRKELKWCPGEVIKVLSGSNHVLPVSKKSKKQVGTEAKIRWDANPATREEMVVTKQYLSPELWSRRGKVSPGYWRYEFTG